MLIFALDEFERGDELKGYSYFEFIERDLDVGTWKIVLPLTVDNRSTVDRWLNSDFPGIQVHDPDTGARTYGFVEEDNLTVSASGREVTVTGSDLMDDLESRMVWPGGFDDANEFWKYNRTSQAGAIDDIAAQLGLEALLDFNGVATYRYPTYDKTFPAAPGTGPAGEIAEQGLTVLTLIRSLLAGTAFTARLRFIVDEIQTAGGPELPRAEYRVEERTLSTKVLDVRQKNVEQVSRTRRRAGSTSVIGIGELTGNTVGSGQERIVAQAFTPQIDSASRYRESFINRPTLDATLLSADVQRELAERSPKNVVTALNPTAGMWGRDMDIGWLMPVNVPAISEYTREVLPVVKSTLVDNPATGQRWQRLVEMGAEDTKDIGLLVAAVRRVRALADQTARALNDD